MAGNKLVLVSMEERSKGNIFTKEGLVLGFVFSIRISEKLVTNMTVFCSSVLRYVNSGKLEFQEHSDAGQGLALVIVNVLCVGVIRFFRHGLVVTPGSCDTQVSSSPAVNQSGTRTSESVIYTIK